VFRLRDKGIPRGDKGGERGDQLVRLVVETPSKLTAKQRELLESLARELHGGRAAQPRRKRFLDMVKELFE
jgi:molecular chaperone DnaJ